MNLPNAVQNVLKSILGSEGHSALSLRKSVFDLASSQSGSAGKVGAISGYSALPTYVDKVTQTPYKVVDSDIEKLKIDGLSEDQIFELTVVTAVGNGIGRLEKTLSLIDQAKIEQAR